MEAVTFNPNILVQLRAQLSLEQENAARLLGMPQQKYADIESGDYEPSRKEVAAIAKFYRVLEQTFFRRTVPKRSKRIDFRTSLPGLHGQPGPILDAIGFASSVQRLLLGLEAPTLRWALNGNRRLTLNSDVEFEASSWRTTLGISDEAQTEIPKTLFFPFVRSRIELQGICVLVSSHEERNFKGLTIGAGDRVPIILINSHMQQKTSRTFTLAHEFGHVLMGSDDVSNPYEADSAIERFCNRFAGALLMPRTLMVNLARTRTSVASNATVKWMSNKLKVSMEAIVLRLEECGLVQKGYWGQWKSQFVRRLPSEEPEGGGGNADTVDVGLNKLATLGFLFGTTVPDRYRERGLTDVALYKASRLKPAYVRDLARAAIARLAEVQEYADAEAGAKAHGSG